MFEREKAADPEWVPDIESFLGLDQRQEVRGVLGKGGFGYVFKVYDHQLRMEVALKTLHRVEPGELARFKNEFRRMRGIRHENLVQLDRLVSVGDRCYFTMELVEGPTFLDYARLSDPWGKMAMDAPTYSRGACFESSVLPADPTEVRRLRNALKQLALGVNALHQEGLLHRDIKPSNIRVNSQGRVVLLDFGLVKRLGPCVYGEVGNSSTRGIGTPHYMAPEQALGLTVSKASDWYSVGVVLYEALTGSKPFFDPQPKLPREPTAAKILNPAAPQDLSELCQHLLASDPR
ncbi:MAG: serine/threonine-protein kinase, partial [Acidobacteriota bacterium]